MSGPLRANSLSFWLSTLAVTGVVTGSSAHPPSPERSLSPRRDILHERLPPHLQALRDRFSPSPPEASEGPVYTASGPRFEDSATKAALKPGERNTLSPSTPSPPQEARESPPTELGSTRPFSDHDEPVALDPREHFEAQVTPDRATQIEPTLTYHEPFNPSVMPYKRGRALNVVSEDLKIDLEAGRRRSITPTPTVPEGLDHFEVQLTIEAQAGRTIPLPSVSPEQTILRIQTQPPVATRLERDEADNLYIRVNHDGRVSLSLELAAHPRYFGGPLPQRLNRALVPPLLRPQLPPRALAEAKEVLARLQLHPESELHGALTTLVRYFRDFEVGPLPPGPGSLYRQLALGQKGVCRHRVYAFVITVQALGLPARYVFNEAHVFAEVYLPTDSGGFWRRLDLGGAAESLTLKGMENKTLHQPASDPFGGLEDPAGAARIQGLPTTASTSGLPSNPTPPLPNRPKPAPFLKLNPDTRRLPTQVTLKAEQSTWDVGRPLQLYGTIESPQSEKASGFVQVWVVLEDGSEERLAITELDTHAQFKVVLARPPHLFGRRVKLKAGYLGDLRHSPSESL